MCCSDFIAARQLTLPSRPALLMLLSLVWLISVGGVVLDKFVYTFPLDGAGRPMLAASPSTSRAAGTLIVDRTSAPPDSLASSICCGHVLLPILAMIIVPRVRSFVMRLLIVAITVGAVILTTQKGSLAAVLAVGMIMCAPEWSRMACCAGRVRFLFAVAAVALPLMTAGLLTPTGRRGVFSSASFAMRDRVDLAGRVRRWISQNNAFPFGVGLGGIGGAQRFCARPIFSIPRTTCSSFFFTPIPGCLSLLYLGWASCVG